MPLVQSFQDLIVWQRAFRVSLDIHKKSLLWPKEEQFGGIAGQIRRSSKSVAANLTEGASKQSSATEFGRFISMALGSANETQLWLMYAQELGYESEPTVQAWRSDYEELTKMLSALRKNLLQRK
jgi:four helix bundle protein